MEFTFTATMPTIKRKTASSERIVLFFLIANENLSTTEFHPFPDSHFMSLLIYSPTLFKSEFKKWKAYLGSGYILMFLPENSCNILLHKL